MARWRPRIRNGPPDIPSNPRRLTTDPCNKVYGLPNPYDQHQSLHPPSEEVDAWKQKVKDYYVESDLTQYRKVTTKTILELGQILCT